MNLSRTSPILCGGFCYHVNNPADHSAFLTRRQNIRALFNRLVWTPTLTPGVFVAEAQYDKYRAIILFVIFEQQKRVLWRILCLLTVTAMYQQDPQTAHQSCLSAPLSNFPMFTTTLCPTASTCARAVRVHPRCKNGSCEITWWLFKTFSREKSCVIEQEPFLQWVNSLLPQWGHIREALWWQRGKRFDQVWSINTRGAHSSDRSSAALVMGAAPLIN